VINEEQLVVANDVEIEDLEVASLKGCVLTIGTAGTFDI
jgi:hypothetical protein